MPVETPPVAPAALQIPPQPAAPPPPAAPPIVSVAPEVPGGTITAPPVLQRDPADLMVTIPLSTIQRYQDNETRLAKVEADRRQAEAAAQVQHATAVAKNGQLEEGLRLLQAQSDAALAAARQEKAQTEDRAKRYALDGEVSRALNEHQLVEGGADQLRDIWRGAFVAEPQGDSYAVRTPTFQPVGDFIREQLKLPKFRHFLPATTSGGVGTVPGAAATIPTPAEHAPATPAMPAPQNFGAAILADWRLNKPTQQPLDPLNDGGFSFDPNGRATRRELPGFGLRA